MFVTRCILKFKVSDGFLLSREVSSGCFVMLGNFPHLRPLALAAGRGHLIHWRMTGIASGSLSTLMVEWKKGLSPRFEKDSPMPRDESQNRAFLFTI